MRFVRGVGDDREVDENQPDDGPSGVDDPGVSSGTPDDDAQLAAFWEQARTKARLDWLGAYGGPTVLGSLRPPAWSFGASTQEADEFVAKVLDDTSDAEEWTDLEEYESTGTPLPERGAVSIVLDGAGVPRALVLTVDVLPARGLVREQFRLLYPTSRHR